MKPSKAKLESLAKARGVMADNRAVIADESDTMELKRRLHIWIQLSKTLEGKLAISDSVWKALRSELDMSEQLVLEMKEEIMGWKEKHRQVYHDLRMQRQISKRRSTKQELLESQIDILKQASRNSKAQLATHTQESQRAMDALMKVNDSLRSELSDSLSTWRNQIEYVKSKLQKTTATLRSTKTEVTRLQKTVRRAAGVRDRAVTKAKAQITEQRSTHKLMSKGVFTEETRNVVRLLVKAGCSARYINEVIAAVLESAGMKVQGSISRASVSRIVCEGFIAAQIQLGYEMKEAESMTFSADGTGHRSINYNSRHIHVLVENYNPPNESSQNPSSEEVPAQPQVRATQFLGIKPSRDNSSKEAIADWRGTISDITDLYSRSPFGKRTGSLIGLIDVLIKLTGMNSDHCAKEKKDAAEMEELKRWAVDQHLGDEALQEKTIEEVNVLYKRGEKDMIRKAGGQSKWAALTPELQAERKATMIEGVVAELGNEAFEMLEEHERRFFRLFIWAGCGCHKDLNTVRGGYAAMSKWWEENNVEGPVLLANRDNAPVIEEGDDALEAGDELTPAQERALERTTGGAIKMVQIAGAIFNHKDDKKGHHDLFRWWWFEHVGIPFTFPDTSNNRFQSNCRAAAVLLLYWDHFIAFLDNLRDNKTNRKLNHMETNLWNALHCEKTKSELVVLALYAESISYPYMKAIRASGNTQNMLDLGTFHQKVADHIQTIVDNPDLLLGDEVSPNTSSLDGEPWVNPEVMNKIRDLTASLPHLRDLLVTFFEGAHVTWRRFTSKFAPGGLIDEATAEEKELAWMPSTNDENEGALGSFRRLMARQPQLSLINQNALAMFFRNDTKAFMAAKFTRDEDCQFLRTVARESQGQDRRRRQELVHFRDERQEVRNQRREKRRQAAEERARRLADLSIILDKDVLWGIKGQKMQDQIAIFKAAGAPNLQGKMPSRADDKRTALVEAVELYESGEWIIDGLEEEDEEESLAGSDLESEEDQEGDSDTDSD